MHYRTAVLLASLCLAPALQAAELPLPAAGQPALRVQGSNTVGDRLMPALLTSMLSARGYQDVSSQSPALDELQMTARDAQGVSLQFQISSHGTRSGFVALKQGKADMAAASRALLAEEAASLSSLGDLRSPQGEHVIGIDGLAIITHPSNPVRSLSTAQLAAVFSGQIRDWSELGFKGPIQLYARDENSGTWDTFRNLVLQNRGLQLSSQARRLESSEQLSELVSSDPQAIGFISLPYVRKARALEISDGPSRSMPPTPELVASEDYPLARRLYLYTPPSGSAWALALAEHAESDAGQQIVASLGFVPQRVQAMPVRLQADMPPMYSDLVRQGRRLNTTFRFAEGSTELDSKALRDVERVVEYLKNNDKLEGKVVLVGFDARQSSTNAQLISRLRAVTVQRHLARAGVLVKDNLGMGDALPVADDQYEQGRIRNSRVEVWVL